MNIELMQILKVILYFIVYSFMGWVVESVFKTILSKKWINSGFLYGPFCPIYGFGAIIMMATFSPIKDNPILVFIVAFFVLSIWEYIAGWILEKRFNTKYWDYTENFMNINGRVCLLNSIFWGILGVAFIMFIHPFMQKNIEILSKDELLFLDCMFAIIIIFDTIITTIHIKSFDTSLNKIKELGETIKQKIAELKENGEGLEYDKTNSLIEDLKIKQAMLKFKLYKQMSRLKLAFPKIKSESISSFLNQKIDFKELREKIKDKIKH